MENVELIKEFHNSFDQPIFSKDNPITPERAKLRLSLALEELTELAEALGLNNTFSDLLYNQSVKILKTAKDKIDTNLINLPEVLDALADIEVINNGTIIETGLSEVYQAAFEAVHKSNMSKLCTTEKEVIDSLQSYTDKGIEVYSNPLKCGKIAIKRKGDNKILKNVYYQPFDAKQFI